MKQLVVLFFLILAAGTGNRMMAQCNSKVVLTASKTVYLDSANKEVRSVDEVSTIVIDSSGIAITPGNGNLMKGKVTMVECKWTVPYKEGKSIMKALLTDGGDEERAVTMTIESKSGTTTFLIAIDNDPNKKIRLVADKFSSK